MAKFLDFGKRDEKIADFPKKILIKSDFAKNFPDFPILKSLIIGEKFSG